MRANRTVKSLALATLACAALFSTGCVTPSGETAHERHVHAVRIRDEALEELYARNPESRDVIASSPGYLFSSGGSIHPGLLTFAKGWCIVQDNKTGEQKELTYWRFGIGPGLAIKGNYGVLVADSEEFVAQMMKSGGANGGVLEASLKFGSFGGSATATTTPAGLKAVYGWTHTGFALQAFWIFTRSKPTDEF